MLRSPNSSLKPDKEDVLYHFGLTNSQELVDTFGGTKFICAGGSSSRIKLYAEIFASETGIPCSENLSRSDRFAIYKTGPVLWINHGMGAPSLSIMLVETFKLLHYAKAQDVQFFRLGTSGGVGVEPGTVVVTSGAVNGALREEHVQWIGGVEYKRPSTLDPTLRGELVELAKTMNIPVESGRTLCADDYYEGQMRLDGFFCGYSADDKFAFLKKIHEQGVRNIEMESTCFASFTSRAGIKAAIVCVTLLNRMNGDQVNIPKDQYIEYEKRPFALVVRHIRNRLAI